ncbi:hypothetical protein [Ancylobacter oerskovii]|uniref:Uncharacterized protein n=1 Tax=Ancylobacter oerskovii TaxID=459519 RepID=A0ABW4Z4K1_9HYPH|nr:hypothetical protein [Ancylobacter oerskovii]MBS7543064.1 hypothetical protein [Ancylobacter oerskovii]
MARKPAAFKMDNVSATSATGTQRRCRRKSRRYCGREVLILLSVASPGVIETAGLNDLFGGGAQARV